MQETFLTRQIILTSYLTTLITDILQFTRSTAHEILNTRDYDMHSEVIWRGPSAVPWRPKSMKRYKYARTVEVEKQRKRLISNTIIIIVIFDDQWYDFRHNKFLFCFVGERYHIIIIIILSNALCSDGIREYAFLSLLLSNTIWRRATQSLYNTYNIP